MFLFPSGMQDVWVASMRWSVLMIRPDQIPDEAVEATGLPEIAARAAIAAALRAWPGGRTRSVCLWGARRLPPAAFRRYAKRSAKRSAKRRQR